MKLEAPVWSDIERPHYPRLAGSTKRADVAVIGGGFAGLSAAYHLLKRQSDARVVVLEADRLGAGASGHTSGMVGPGVGQSLAFLVRHHGVVRAKALYLASIRAVEFLCRFVAQEKLDCELEMTGHLIVAHSSAGRGRLAARAQLMAQLDLPFEILSDDELDLAIRLAVSGRRANSDHRDGPAALRVPGAGVLHPMRLIRSLADRVTARGGSIFENSSVSRIEGSGPLRLVFEDGAAVIAKQAIVATGGYTPRLGLFRGRILPVHLQIVVTAPLDAQAREIIRWKGREGILDNRRLFSYFRLTADSRIVFGGGNPRYLWGGRTDDRRQGACALDRLVHELTHTFPPAAQIQVTHGWTGVIDYVLDTLPAIERASGRPCLFHTVGWSGHGIALSIASGSWIAEMICDGTVPEDLPWYRSRPPLVPFEALRWAAFHTAVHSMALMDAIR